MIFQREALSAADAFYHYLTTGSGIVEILIAVICVLLGGWSANWVFQRWFAGHPERYEQFLPYVGSRMLLPLFSQLLIMIASAIWMLILKQKTSVLPVASAMLFWLAIIRLMTAVVRQALPEGRFERHTEHLMATLCWVAFVTWFTNFDAIAVEWLQSISLRVGKTRVDLSTILSAILWVSIVLVGTLWISKVIESRLMQLNELDQSLRIVFAKLTRTVLMIAAVLFALPIVGIDLTMLSVFTGALGVGLGFGLQKIASNYVSGFIILLDRSIRLGDRLMVENRVGCVSKMTARYVVLKSLDGSEALVPNDTLIANTVINQSYSDTCIWTSIVVSVAYGTDLDVALHLLGTVGRHPRIAIKPAPRAYVTQFADSGITLELGFWINDPENGFMGLKSDLLLAVWHLFKENNIQMPFPQREIRILKDSDNTHSNFA